MNKVIAALDGLKVSESTLAYATYLSKEFNAHIVATFLEDIVYHGQTGQNTWEKYKENDWSEIDTLTRKEEEIRATSVKKVQKRFNAEGVQYNVHRDELIAIQSIVKESHFADLILINANESFSDWDTSKPSRFIKNLLADADCPLMVVPNEFKEIKKFVFAYDGSPASVYAIRQFTYLFASIADQQIEVVMATDEQHSNHFPKHYLLKELLKRKYPKIQQTILKSSESQEALVDYLEAEGQQCLVVLGAYQRSSFSRWLNASFADTLISNLDIPLFIAHK